MMARHSVNIVQDEEAPIPKDMLAAAICKLSDCVNKLLLSGLNEDAVIVLLKDSTGLSKRNIQLVLNSLSQLRTDYTHDS